jgi:hypothetical protein
MRPKRKKRQGLVVLFKIQTELEYEKKKKKNKRKKHDKKLTTSITNNIKSEQAYRRYDTS